MDSSETSPDSYHSACTVSEKYSPAASMACQQKTFVSRETEIDRGQGRTHSPNADGRTSLWSPGPAQQAPLKESGLFNHGEPDLSVCDLLAANIDETKSDQPSTVDVEKFTDLMLFPELMDVFEDLQVFQDFPIDPLGGVDDPLKTRDLLPSCATVTDGGETSETSPAESDTSVDHFFNTFTDLAGFLQELTEETGPTDLTDVAAAIPESNNSLTTDAEISATPTTPPPTLVGPETANNGEVERADLAHSSPSEDETEPPAAKKACTSCPKTTALDPVTKYRTRRDKNNIASQRSRASRKQREIEMAAKAEELEADNARLRLRIDELTAIAEDARKCLVAAMSQK